MIFVFKLAPQHSISLYLKESNLYKTPIIKLQLNEINKNLTHTRNWDDLSSIPFSPMLMNPIVINQTHDFILYLQKRLYLLILAK